MKLGYKFGNAYILKYLISLIEYIFFTRFTLLYKKRDRFKNKWRRTRLAYYINYNKKRYIIIIMIKKKWHILHNSIQIIEMLFIVKNFW